MFSDELRQLADKHDSVRLHEQFTESDGRFEVDAVPDVCPDWRERQAWRAGPSRCSTRPRSSGRTPTWRTACTSSVSPARRSAATAAKAGTSASPSPDIEVDVDGATTLMQAGEDAGITMPYGCRMGICHTCVVPLVEGVVRDLRNGADRSEPNEPVQTCVTAAAGDCVLDI